MLPSHCLKYLYVKLKIIIMEFIKNFKEDATLSRVKKAIFIKELTPLLGATKTQQLWNIRHGILISELEQTVKNSPNLTKEQVLRLFSKVAHVNPQDNIHGGRILRGLLIDIVATLEAYTGKKISQDADAPLAYLEDARASDEIITVEDFAEFFSDSGTKLQKLIEKSAVTL